MNQIDFTQTGGFPFDQGTLNFIQSGILTAQQLANLLGPLAIITGCGVTGSVAAPGYVAINGEVLPFTGGAVAAKVIVVEIDTELTYFDGSTPQVVKTRVAQFGDDGVQNNPWANFVVNTPGGILARIVELESEATALNEDVAAINTDIATIESEITALQAVTPVQKLASGSAFYIGNIPTGGTSYYIPFNTPLANNNYMVHLTLISNGSDPSQDQCNSMAVTQKTTTGFTIYLHEPGSMTQDLTLDWLVISF